MKYGTRFECSNFSFSPICVGDAGMLFKVVSSHNFPKLLPLAKIQTLEQAESWCKNRASEWKSEDCFVWSCREISSSQIVGQVTILPKAENLALAYWVDPDVWGQGVATEMCSSLLTHLKIMGYRGKIWAGVHSWNKRSSAVLEKLGFAKVDASKKDTFEYMFEISR